MRFIVFYIITFITTIYCTFSQTRQWVGTWYTAPQLVETNNNPPSPGLANNALRQVVKVSIGGDSLRLKLSNAFSSNNVVIKSVQIAVSTGGSTINAATSKDLKFNGNTQLTMNAGAMITSDPLAFHLESRMTLAITINYGSVSASVTGHPGSRTTSYILTGTATANTNFANAVKTEHWYNILGIDVRANTEAASVAILGNSITDGRGTTTDKQNRWTDILSERLIVNPGTEKVGILNSGIGGNCLLKDCLGPSGTSRFKRDVLDQAGIKVAIIAEAVNDIGGVNSANTSTSMYNSLVNAYTKMVTDAHALGIKIYAATVMPFKGNSYYNQYSEQCRNNFNNWIRTNGKFDAIIDFDKAMGSPSDPAKLPSSFQNDGLHPDTSGYKIMGNSIDLNLFKNLGTTVTSFTDKDLNTLNSSSLNQNFPNPFSENTYIPFEIPTENYVSLKVYTAMGQELLELAGKIYAPGKHIIDFNRKGLPNGLYYYSLKTGNTTNTRSMFLQE